MAGVGLIPVAGGVIKKMAGLGDAARGLAKGAGALDDVADASRRIDNTIMEAPKIASTGDAVGEVFDPVTKQLKVWQDACFVAGTLVATEQGLRPIEEIRVDDHVWSYDHALDRWRQCRVALTLIHERIGEVFGVMVAGETIESSFHHPYWVIEGRDLESRPIPEHLADAFATTASGALSGRWVDAGNLEEGDVLLLRSGVQAPVQRIVRRTTDESVYNFAVDDLHNYAVGEGGVLVHNNCKVTIGRDAIANAHALRQVIEKGFDANVVQSVIRADVAANGEAFTRGLNIRKVVVDGRELTYNAFLLSQRWV